MNNSPQRAAKGFTRAFWVSNTVELFERMAYYAVFIVLTIYHSGGDHPPRNQHEFRAGGSSRHGTGCFNGYG